MKFTFADVLTQQVMGVKQTRRILRISTKPSFPIVKHRTRYDENPKKMLVNDRTQVTSRDDHSHRIDYNSNTKKAEDNIRDPMV